MSSRISGSLESAFTADTVLPVFLVRVVFNDAVGSENILYLSTWYHDISYDAGDGNGSQTYLPAGSLLTVASVDENSDLGASGLRLTLSGCDPQIVQNARDEDYQGHDCDVYLGAMDSDGSLIGATTYFSGINDNITYTAKQDSIDISLTVENKLIRFGKSKTKRYTDAEQKAEFSTDKGFEFVNSIAEREIKWGQA